jgi:hypothetical protein
MGREELRDVLDYILNQADQAEFEVILKAVQRRQKEMHLFAGIGGAAPAKAARQTASALTRQLGATQEAVRELVGGFIRDIIRKNAPEISQEDLDALVAEYLRSGKQAIGQAPGLPPEALLDMVKRFVAYSTGTMRPSEQKALWDEMPRWQEDYWKAFPAEIKALVQAFLSGKLAQEEFWAAVLGYLGL